MSAQSQTHPVSEHQPNVVHPQPIESSAPDVLRVALAIPVSKGGSAACNGCESSQQQTYQRKVSISEPRAKSRNGGESSYSRRGRLEADDTEYRHCVIIGGGIAGLAAAAELEHAGLDFVLLEAGDRLGGRIHTDEASRGRQGRYPLELGAQWLHGTEGNPLFDFCLEEGIFDSGEGKANFAEALEERYISEEVQVRSANGSKMDTQEFLHASEAWSRAVAEAAEASAAMFASDSLASPTARHMGNTVGKPVSRGDVGEHGVGEHVVRRMRELLSASVGEAPVPGGKPCEEDPDAGVIGYFERLQCSIEGCDDLRGLCLSGYEAYEELPGGNLRVPGGFSSVVEVLASKTRLDRIRHGSTVSCVRWAAQWEGEEEQRDAGSSSSSHAYPCTVEYTTMASPSPSHEGDGAESVRPRRIKCRHVLVTLGLGVLKAEGAVKFMPPLPPSKLSAIRRLGFGTVDKIFLRCTRGDAPLHGGDESSETTSSSGEAARVEPAVSMELAVLRPTSMNPNGTRYEGLPKSGWLDDVHCFSPEGEHMCTWLAGKSARESERIAAPDVEEALVSLLRNVTQDQSWRAKGETRGSNSSIPEDNASEGEPRIAQCGPHDPVWTSSARSASRPLVPGDGRFSYDATLRGTPSLVRSQWNSNPLFRGSYSYIATGSSPADMDELARPLSGVDSWKNGIAMPAGEDGGDAGEPRVFFAGEATHRAFFSTAHGAFESGRRAAREVLRWVPKE